MARLKFIWLILWIVGVSCNGRTAMEKQQEASQTIEPAQRVGGPCETCELIYIDIPESINAADTSAGWEYTKQKLVVSGTMYEPDGNTPASDIILYYWQTDNNGIYANHENLAPEARRHGYIRGWVKTNRDGRYTIYTLRPGSYPNSSNPAHIHLLIKEPGISNEYYIDDILFEDDTLLTDQIEAQLENRGGRGVVDVRTKDGVQYATRDIILGRNISNYPSRE